MCREGSDAIHYRQDEHQEEEKLHARRTEIGREKECQRADEHGGYTTTKNGNGERKRKQTITIGKRQHTPL